MSADTDKLSAMILLAISEVHSGNGAEGERIADAAILALREWLEERGMVVVPREAPLEMLFKGEEAMADKDVALIMRRKDGKASATETVLDTLYAGDVWSAMIAAAPDALRAEGE
jgi:hypothetical protein